MLSTRCVVSCDSDSPAPRLIPPNFTLPVVQSCNSKHFTDLHSVEGEEVLGERSTNNFQASCTIAIECPSYCSCITLDTSLHCNIAASVPKSAGGRHRRSLRFAAFSSAFCGRLGHASRSLRTRSTTTGMGTSSDGSVDRRYGRSAAVQLVRRTRAVYLEGPSRHEGRVP